MRRKRRGHRFKRRSGTFRKGRGRRSNRFANSSRGLGSSPRIGFRL